MNEVRSRWNLRLSAWREGTICAEYHTLEEKKTVTDKRPFEKREVSSKPLRNFRLTAIQINAVEASLEHDAS